MPRHFRACHVWRNLALHPNKRHWFYTIRQFIFNIINPQDKNTAACAGTCAMLKSQIVTTEPSSPSIIWFNSVHHLTSLNPSNWRPFGNQENAPKTLSSLTSSATLSQNKLVGLLLRAWLLQTVMRLYSPKKYDYVSNKWVCKLNKLEITATEQKVLTWYSQKYHKALFICTPEKMSQTKFVTSIPISSSWFGLVKTNSLLKLRSTQMNNEVWTSAITTMQATHECVACVLWRYWSAKTKESDAKWM